MPVFVCAFYINDTLPFFDYIYIYISLAKNMNSTSLIKCFFPK